jgi:CheY-like chemotaxis protein
VRGRASGACPRPVRELSLPDAPLVLYSASMTPELAAQARNFSVAALLEKPVSPGRLVEVVRTATTLDGRPPHPAAEP